MLIVDNLLLQVLISYSPFLILVISNVCMIQTSFEATKMFRFSVLHPRPWDK